LAADTPLIKWPLKRDAICRYASVKGRLIVNTGDLALRGAIDGLGLAYITEALALPFLRTGQLVRVLEDWSPVLEGLFLYYPGHRQVPSALRAFIDMFQATLSAGRAKNPLQNPFLRTGNTMPLVAKRRRSSTIRNGA
jgi:DNA-binding transcriptional LysR family regulator